MSRKPKLAVVVTHPIQHFSPVYRALASRGRADVVVIYLTDAGARPYFDPAFGKTLSWDIDLLSGYRHRFLRQGLEKVPKGFFKADSPEITGALSEEDPDAVLVFGYAKRLNWRARNWAVSRHRRFFYWSDSILLRPRGIRTRTFKQIVVRTFFRKVDVFLAAGDKNEDYLRHYGAQPSQMRRCPLPIDTARLAAGNASDSATARAEVRAALGLGSDSIVMLFCGKMTPIKRAIDVVEAVGMLRTDSAAVHAVFVGAGPLRDSCVERARALGVQDRCHFVGFVNQSEIRRYYCAADLLVIPSSEDAHPLVATEGALFGLPLVVSDQVGCVGPTDVARENVNALVFPCGDIAVLKQAVLRLARDGTLRTRMAAEGRNLAATQDIAVAANAIEEALLDRHQN